MKELLITLLIAMPAQAQIFECQACVPRDNNIPQACDGPQSFRNGTLWKPESDSTNKLVVLLAESFDFDECEVKEKDLSWTLMQFTGRTNGNRQTYRAPKTGGAYAGKRKNGGVRCFVLQGGNRVGECQFFIPGPARNRHE